MTGTRKKPILKTKEKKISNKIIFILGAFLFILALLLDNYANLFFKGPSFPFLNAALSIATNFGLVVVVFVAIPTIIFFKKDRHAVYQIWVAFLASFAAALLIKFLFLRQRPLDIDYPVITIINYSFPSTHSIVVFSLLPILLAYMPNQNRFWISSAFLVAFSRIYLGFHFLSDVIFGIFSGFLIGNFLLYRFSRNENKQV